MCFKEVYMMRKVVIFVLFFIVSVYSHAAAFEDLYGSTSPSLLVYNNGNGILDLVTNIGLTLGTHYDVWDESNASAFSTFADIQNAGYKLVLTGSGGNYGSLATEMAADKEAWRQNSGRIALSGQSADSNSGEWGANVLLYNLLIWGFSDYVNGTVGFIAFSDAASLWSWTPWMSSGTTGAAQMNSGSSVDVTPYSTHLINEGDGEIYDPLTNADLSNWTSNSYDADFTALPTGFSAVSQTGSGNALTIVNTPVVVITIPEPASLFTLMLAFGTFLGFWSFAKKS